MQDKEIRVQFLDEMLFAMLSVMEKLDDRTIEPLLPLLFPFVQKITAHAHGNRLRATVANVINRIGRLYKFSLD